MKTHLAWRIVAALACGGLGFLVGTIYQRQSMYSEMSLAGQTLLDVSRALESARSESGSYPSTLPEIRVTSSSSEFSKAVLSRVIYHKTETGYVALVGLPKVAYIQPGSSTEFK